MNETLIVASLDQALMSASADCMLLAHADLPAVQDQASLQQSPPINVRYILGS